MLTPKEAYYKAKEGKGTDELRTLACSDRCWAYSYTKDVDKTPINDTRNSACLKPKWAYCYTNDITKPKEDTRAEACGSPQWAFEYALKVDEKSRLDTYIAVLKSARYRIDYENHLTIPKQFVNLKKSIKHFRKKIQSKNDIIC